MDMFNNEGNRLNTETEKPAQRHHVELKFEFKRSYGRQLNLATVRNISLTGALIKTDQPLKMGEKISVFLTVQGRRRRVSARVVWSGPLGYGVQFQPFNNRDVQIVDDIIYYATEKAHNNKDLLESILSKVAA